VSKPLDGARYLSHAGYGEAAGEVVAAACGLMGKRLEAEERVTIAEVRSWPTP